MDTDVQCVSFSHSAIQPKAPTAVWIFLIGINKKQQSIVVCPGINSSRFNFVNFLNCDSTQISDLPSDDKLVEEVCGHTREVSKVSIKRMQYHRQCTNIFVNEPTYLFIRFQLSIISSCCQLNNNSQKPSSVVVNSSWGNSVCSWEGGIISWRLKKICAVAHPC